MAKLFDPRKVLRQVSNALLKEFFSRRGELEEVPWDELKETHIGPIFDGWQALPDDDRNEVQVLLQDVNELADERGLGVLAEEIQWRAPQRLKEFGRWEGRMDRVMWVDPESAGGLRGGRAVCASRCPGRRAFPDRRWPARGPVPLRGLAGGRPPQAATGTRGRSLRGS